jgi:hypothetical protein
VVLEEPVLQEAVLELQPWPVLQLAWHGGDQEEEEEPAPQATHLPTAAGPLLTAVSHRSSSSSTEDEHGTDSFPGLVLAFEDEVGATSSSSSNGGSRSGRKRELEDLTNQQLQEQWQQAGDDGTSGVPLVWLDFKPPFAEPPPVLVPPKPELGAAPVMFDVLLEEVPVYQEPVLQPLPAFSEPPLVVPKWVPPCEPFPIGFMRGAAPLLIMDVSGTMHPAQRGQIHRVKSCVAGLLTPTGRSVQMRAAGPIDYMGGTDAHLRLEVLPLYSSWSFLSDWCRWYWVGRPEIAG